MYYDIGAYDMLYSEFKEMCRKTWRERLNYLSFDMTKHKNDGKYRIFSEKKTHILKVFAKVNLFSFLNVVSN